jgi:hypothetical protein
MKLTAEQLIRRVVEGDAYTRAVLKLQNMSLTALQGVWRRMEIGPMDARPSDKDDLIDDIMSELMTRGQLPDDDESAPKGWEPTVLAMKKHKEIDNPWALAHYMKNKGYKSRT